MVYTSAYAVMNENEHHPPETLLLALLPLLQIVDLCLFRNRMAGGDFLLSLPGLKLFTITVARLAKAVGRKLKIVVDSCKEKAMYISQLGFSPEQVFMSEDVEKVLILVRKQCEKSHSGALHIITHDFSPLAQEVWRCTSAFCRFMVGDNSGEAASDPLPFTRGASFLSATLKALCASPQAAAELLKLSLHMFKIYPELYLDTLDSSIKVFDIADNSNSFDHAEQQHEASVVRFGYGEIQMKVATMLSLQLTD